MKKGIYIGTNKEEFKRIIDAHTSKDVELDRISRIRSKYSRKYRIEGEAATIRGRKVHIDYLPTIDMMLEAKKRYAHSKEVVGAALFKIENDECLFLTDSNDIKLRHLYAVHNKDAKDLASRLLKLNTEEFDYQWTHVLAQVLGGSFSTVFNQSYGDWRKSLFKIINK